MRSFELVLFVKFYFSLLSEIMNLDSLFAISLNLPNQLVTILYNPV